MKVIIYAIRGTTHWWRYISEQMPSDDVVVISDATVDVDFTTKERFYESFAEYSSSEIDGSALLDSEVVKDVITRCRVLRALEYSKAVAMVLAMADAFDEILDKVNPTVVLSFPIDRYVSDVLYRLTQKRNVPFVEYTASPLPRRAMFMSRGQLLGYKSASSAEQVKSLVSELVEPNFHPSYVQKARNFGLMKWIRVFLYFRARATFFWFRSWLESDGLDLHYLDAQSWLPHKVKIKDIFFSRYMSGSWRSKCSNFPQDKIIVIGLTVFPEASIDYWISDSELIDYEERVLELSALMSELGFCILVKDHPQQFGFRQCGFLDRLSKIDNVVLVPYDVSANQLLELAGWSFTFTGTMGLQAALLGKKSIVCKNYYSNGEDFLEFSNITQFYDLEKSVNDFARVDSLEERQQRIVEAIERGSFECDFFAFSDFKLSGARESSKRVAEILYHELSQYLSKAV